MALEIDTNDLSPFAQMVELQLAAKGIEYSRRLPDRAFIREGAYGEMNSLRKMPAIILDGAVIPESQVIGELLEELFTESPLLPADPLARARVRLLSRIGDLYFAVPLGQLLHTTLDAEGKATASLAINMVERGARGLEQWLEVGEFAIGDRISVADCMLAPALFTMTETIPNLNAHPLPQLGPKALNYFKAVQRHEHVSQCLERMRASLSARTALLAKQAQ